MDMAFELRQLRLFQKMVTRGLIYRKYKPVYWSPSSGSALAEAELEYNENHVSTSAYVRFPIVGDDWRQALSLEEVEGRLYAVIWTTTPWTLPANRTIAIHDELDYVILRVGDDAVIVAESLVSAVQKACYEEQELKVIRTVKGERLKSLQYRNVLRGKDAAPQPIIHGSFVSSESGSGLVHCAPGHGFDDYEVCMSLGLEGTAPVDNDGKFTEDAYPEAPERLKGISVLQGGSKAVLELLGSDILAVQSYTHKYPYDWRTKQPIIIRATAQWFADVAHIKDAALKALEDVRFVPEGGRNRLEAFVKGRSEWCISRQRAWGMPIPALYDQNGEAIMTEESIEHIISIIQERGTDAWWSDDPNDPAWILPALRDKGPLRRGTDTMDVWFDSGSSWTLQDQQADVYLEGSDQHRGWFQSSLLTRVAALTSQTPNLSTTQVGLSPFKTLITHGFTLDQAGKKMSKSLGNIISADKVMDGSLLPPLKPKKKSATAQPIKDALGPDALRLWAASSDYTRDVVLSEPVLKSVHQSLVKYRTIIKMLLGSMQENATTAPLTALDHIAIIQLKDVMEEVQKSYDNYDFQKAVSAINRWVANDLSAFYLEGLKDRLYCADGGGVLEPIFFGFLRMLAPIMPVLVEEAWDHAPAWLTEDQDILHPLRQLYSAPLIDPSRLTQDESQLKKAIPVLLTAHSAVKGALEEARIAKYVGSSLQSSVVFHVPEESMTLKMLEPLRNELEAIFVVSHVDIEAGDGAQDPSEGQEWSCQTSFEVGDENVKVWVLPPKEHKCPRCWRYVSPKEDELCKRCDDVVAAL